MSTFFLVGMPGAGKTHWGRIWSRSHNFKLYDLDDLVEQTAGIAIPEIIRAMGENGFRTIESEVLLATVNRSREENAIISCGGGTPTLERNLRLMRRTGCIIYLEAPPDVLLMQLRRSPVVRPLLQQLTIERLQTLLTVRKRYYEQADVIVPLSKAHPGTFAEIIEACINRHSSPE